MNRNPRSGRRFNEEEILVLKKVQKVGVKYCGGCNPYYDRVALVERIKSRLKGKAEFVGPSSDEVDLVLAVEGCQTACAYLNSFKGKPVHIITRKEDADTFLQNFVNP